MSGAIQSLFSYIWGSPSSTPTETIPEVPSIPFHIGGIQPRKARATPSKKKSKGARKAVVMTIKFAIKEKKEESTVRALKEEIRKELEIDRNCELKLFYAGDELQDDADLLSWYVLDQERDTLFDPHIVVAVKEGLVQPSVATTTTTTATTTTTPPPPSSKTEEKEEKKVEEPTKSSTTNIDTNITVTWSPKEQALKDYEKFEVKLIKDKDPILLEECSDCYALPGCGHGMTGDSLYAYLWSSLKDKKEVSIRCPHINEQPDNQAGSTPCAKPLPYVALKKILSYHFDKKKSKSKAIEDALDKIFALEACFSENRLHDAYDAQKCNKCDSILYRELKADKSAHIKFKSVCPVCTFDSEEANGDKSNLKRKASMFNRMFCTDAVDKTNASNPTNATTNATVTQNTEAKVDTSEVKQESPTTTATTTATTTTAITTTTTTATTTITTTEEKKEEEKTPSVNDANVHYFCWSCGNDWEGTSNDFCGNTDCLTRTRADIINLLATCETKTIGQVGGVPEIRGCPTCGQMVNHTEACKHMTCRCTAAFCFVCMKPKTKEGNWQCGSSGDVCPVYKRQTNEDLPAGNRSVVNLFDLAKK